VKVNYIVFVLMLFPSLSAAAADYEYEMNGLSFLMGSGTP
jgi:hypothetical protein